MRKHLTTVSHAERRVGAQAPNASAERRELIKQAAEKFASKIGRYITRIEYVEKQLLTRQHLSANDIQRLRIVAEINFRKIDKVIPDVKHITGTIEPKGAKSMDELVAEAQQLGLDVKKLFEDYAYEPGDLIDGEAVDVSGD